VERKEKDLFENVKILKTVEKIVFPTFIMYALSSSIVEHAHLPCFLRYDIFHFTKFKVVSNRLPLFSFCSGTLGPVTPREVDPASAL